MLKKYKNRIQRLTNGIRVWQLNRSSGVEINRTVCLHPSSAIDLTGDGYCIGGELRIGSRTKICAGAILAPYGGRIEIGESVFIGPYCVIYGHGGVKIGKNVMIAAHCTIIPANHIFSDPAKSINFQSQTMLGIEIQDSTWLGTGVRVLDGVVIGCGSVIGAGSVVTRSIPPMSVAVGVPARVIRSRL